MGILLNLDHISFIYPKPEGETPVLHDVSFHISEGEFVAIVGPCGSGKSTLLSLVAGLLSPSNGLISMNSTDIKSSGVNIGYMPQKGPYTISDNSYLQINEFTKTYGMITFINTYPSVLTACTKQRVALIRSLLLESDLILLDEPFSALDEETRLYAAADIWSILRKENKTVLLATQEVPTAVRMADRVIILSSTPCTIKQILDIKLSEENRTILGSKASPEFKEYLDMINEKM